MADSNATDRFHAEIWPLRAQVLRLALMLTHDEADAQDLAQDALLKTFAAIDSLAPGTNARAWLMRVLRNAHVDRLRREHDDALSLESLAMEPADEHDRSAAEDSSEWGDARAVLASFADRQIIAALRALPREICWTLLLIDVQGMDDREAAEVLGVPVGTVKSRAHRGRKMLRESLLPLAKDLRIGRAVR